MRRATFVTLALCGYAGAQARAAETTCDPHTLGAESLYIGLPGDPASSFVGGRVATDTLHDWIPRDPYKQVVCGTLDHVGFFHNVTAEFDWDLYISPSPKYALFADDPAAEPCVLDPLGRKGALATKTKERPKCLSAEVTAPTGLRTANPWLNWDRQTSTLIYHDFCVYGPWVSDDAHGSRPEIHPVNALWWEEAGASGARSLVVLQDASGRYQRSEAFRAKDETGSWRSHGDQSPASWIPTVEDLCIGFPPSTSEGQAPRAYRLQTTGHTQKAFEIEMGPGGPDVPPCATAKTRQGGEPLELCSENGVLRLSLHWDAPQCDYCGEEKFVALRIFPVPSPAGDVAAPPPLPPPAEIGSGCEDAYDPVPSPEVSDQQTLPLPLSLQPAPRADAVWLEERPTAVPTTVDEGVWEAFLSHLGVEARDGLADTWPDHLVGITESDLTVAREYEGSVGDWSVIWDTCTLRQMTLRTPLMRRIISPSRVQGESVRIFLHARPGFHVYQVAAHVVQPTWGARQTRLARTVANYGVSATVDEVLELLDNVVPLREQCSSIRWSDDQGPSQFRVRHVRTLVDNENGRSIRGALGTGGHDRRVFTFASLQKIIEAARQQEHEICRATLSDRR